MIMMDIYPVKAQYLTGENVEICLEPESLQYDMVILSVYRLEEKIWEKTIGTVSLFMKISIGSFEDDFSGYGVVAKLIAREKQDFASTAFDVVRERKKSLRYGFVSDFDTLDGDKKSMDVLRRYHINMVQFYDWSYRHDHLVADSDAYHDMMGKRIDSHVLQKKILEAKSYGMMPVAYGAVYAASEEFYEEHKDWAFYNSTQQVFRFINVFYLMNIEKNSPWRKHIIEQYADAIHRLGFSGIHMDTYGFPKTAYSHLEHKNKLIHLEEEFPGLIDDTAERFANDEQRPVLIFNNVGNWPVRSTANHGVAAVYIEVWPPYEKYCHIKQLITEAKNILKEDKPVILAAYLAPFRTGTEETGKYAAFLLMAVIFSNGGYHLLLGEENAVLTQGYYSDYSIISEETAGGMRAYYDFMVRYMNLFYDPSLKDVTMTHLGWDNYEYQCQFKNWSACGEPGKIWITIRENASLKCIYLVNLCGISDDYWNKGKTKPLRQSDLKFVVQIDREIKGVFSASPEVDHANSIELAHTVFSTDKGMFIEFVLPELELWTVIYIK